MTYTAPVNAMHYLLRHAVNIDSVLATPAHSETEHDLISDILTGAAGFAQDVLAPINWAGDQNGSTLKDGNVTAAPGFKEAYKSYVEAGWQGIAAPTDIGGMGLPQAVACATNEMFYAANMAWGLCPMLTASATKALHAHASPELQAKYLNKMVTGEWSGAMDLTEPQSGSDLGTLRAKAVPNADGTYALSGQKIYITWGDHDCADNIIHLVLARLPDAPAGSKGISLFLAPKYFVNDDGSLGERNSFRPIGLEHKLGVHGSPTCTMEFDGATGWLIGEPNRGLACMFTMMNEARLFVGVQGVAIGDRAYHAALTYARDRVQGRTAMDGDTIIAHPDVRRMLLDMKAKLMGARAICMATAVAGDMALYAQDEDTRKAAHAREALLTPMAKAYGSDVGVETASTGVQIHGGMGFVEETGAAQHYRDSRIAPIYEGTNGIQAIDLVGRKLRRDGGEAMRAQIQDLLLIKDMILPANAKTDVDLSILETAISGGIATLTEATDIMLAGSDEDALAGATPYLRLCSEIIAGSLLIKASCSGLMSGDNGAANMLALTRYHAINVMSQATSNLSTLRHGLAPLAEYPQTALSDL